MRVIAMRSSAKPDNSSQAIQGAMTSGFANIARQ
jgi:hypothetical protein